MERLEDLKKLTEAVKQADNFRDEEVYESSDMIKNSIKKIREEISEKQAKLGSASGEDKLRISNQIKALRHRLNVMSSAL